MNALKMNRHAVRVEPMTPDEVRQCEDMRWAQQSTEVLAKYQGQFVVPYIRKIVAHGDDINTVLAEASRVTGRKPEDLPVVGIVDPLVDVSSF